MKQKLKILGKNFNLKRLLTANISTNDTKQYYIFNKLSYRLFHNKEGFMHMGLSKSSHLKQEDFYEQCNEISRLINTQTISILELGSGQGSNNLRLANQFPNVQFNLIDLSLKPKKMLKNMTFHQANFEQCNMIKNHSQDIVFAIETICHAHNPLLVFREL